MFIVYWLVSIFQLKTRLIVLYCIMRPYTDGPIGPLSYRHSSGVVRNPHSALAEWGIFNLRSISPQGTHLLIARRRNSITSVLASISRMTCLSATCEPRTINVSITAWSAHHVYNIASQPRTSDRLACHWRALSLLAYDNWRRTSSIQPEIFHSLKVPSRSRDSISDRQRESPVR